MVLNSALQNGRFASLSVTHHDAFAARIGAAQP